MRNEHGPGDQGRRERTEKGNRRKTGSCLSQLAHELVAEPTNPSRRDLTRFDETRQDLTRMFAPVMEGGKKGKVVV